MNKHDNVSSSVHVLVQDVPQAQSVANTPELVQDVPQDQSAANTPELVQDVHQD